MLRIVSKQIKLSKDQEFILDKLNLYGQGYVVGGFIRDYLLGVDSKDCDFATDLSLEEVQELFADYKQKVIGKHFQVLSVTINNVLYEIARFRVDKKYGANRTQVDCEFVDSLELDLRRRDFTINAFAYDGVNLYYPSDLNCMEDIQQHKLRFIGNAKERIEEDPLRILRAIRFMQKYNLVPSDDLISVLNKNRKLILKLSAERIRDELKQILSYSVTKYTKQTFLFKNVSETWLNRSENWKLNLAYLLRNYKYKSVDDIRKHILQYLKFSKAEIKDIILLYECTILKEKCFANQIFRYLSYHKAMHLLDVLGLKLNTGFLPINPKDLEITPQELIELGVPTNKIKRVQDVLLDEVTMMPAFNTNNTLTVLVQGMSFDKAHLSEKLKEYIDKLLCE